MNGHSAGARRPPDSWALLFQFLGYMLANLGYMSQTTVAVAVPITLAALCGVLCERSGVVNIGIEGIMLTAAFVGWIVGVAARGALGPGMPLPFFGVTLPLLIGLAAAILVGMAVSLLHAWLAISMRVDQIISGTIVNIGAAGITGYLYTLIASQAPTGAGSFAQYKVPEAGGRPAGGGLADQRRAQPGTDRPQHDRHRDLPPGHALPISLGPADAGGGGASPGGRDRRHRCDPAALPERRHVGRARRARRRLVEHGAD